MLTLSCNKDKEKDETLTTGKTETPFKKDPQSQLALIKRFVNDERMYQNKNTSNFTTQYEFNLCSDCVLTYDSLDYFISNGLNYLHGDVQNEYDDFRVDLSSTLNFEPGYAESYEYDQILGLFATLSSMVCEKREELEAEGGWSIISIELIKEVSSDSELSFTLKFNIGYKGLGVAPPVFGSTACYNWNLGNCSNTSLNSINLPKTLADKIMAYYSWSYPSVASPNRKFLLVDVSNKTVGLEIYPNEYDTENNPYGVPSTSAPTIKPTDIFSYDFGNTTQGSNPLIPLNASKLNYYLEKSPGIIDDFKDNYRPSVYLTEWNKLTTQNHLLSFSITPDPQGTCPYPRLHSWLDVCFSHRHIYKPVYCNYIIVQDPISTCQ